MNLRDHDSWNIPLKKRNLETDFRGEEAQVGSLASIYHLHRGRINSSLCRETRK